MINIDGQELEKINAIISKGKRKLPFNIIDATTMEQKKNRGPVGEQVLLKMMKDRQEERK